MTGRPRFFRVLGLTTAMLSMACAERATAGPYSIDILITPYHAGVVDSWLFDINNHGQASGYIITQPGAFTRSLRRSTAWGQGPSARSKASTTTASSSALSVHPRAEASSAM